MSKVCSVCGKGKLSGNLVSHSNRKTPKSYDANLQKVSYKTACAPTGDIINVFEKPSIKILYLSFSINVLYKVLVQLLNHSIKIPHTL